MRTLYIPDSLLKFIRCGTVFLYFYVQVTWRDGERPIHVLYQSRWSSLKWGGTQHTFIGWRFVLKWFNLSRSSKTLLRLRLNAPDGLLWTHDDISGIRWKSNGVHYMMIQLHAMTRLHLGTPFQIGWMRLKDDDLHLGVLSHSSIKDETPNNTATPKLRFYEISLDASSIG